MLVKPCVLYFLNVRLWVSILEPIQVVFFVFLIIALHFCIVKVWANILCLLLLLSHLLALFLSTCHTIQMIQKRVYKYISWFAYPLQWICHSLNYIHLLLWVIHLSNYIAHLVHWFSKSLVALCVSSNASGTFSLSIVSWFNMAFHCHAMVLLSLATLCVVCSWDIFLIWLVGVQHFITHKELFTSYLHQASNNLNQWCVL